MPLVTRYPDAPPGPIGPPGPPGPAGPPGGGGGVLIKTYTAAQIAARWSNGDSASSLPLTEIGESQWVAGVSEIANTLDQNVAALGPLAYDPGASTTDVYNNGEVLGGGTNANTPGTYQTSITWSVQSGAERIGFLSTGKQAYAMFTGDAAPTTGAITVAIFGS